MKVLATNLGQYAPMIGFSILWNGHFLTKFSPLEVSRYTVYIIWVINNWKPELQQSDKES